MPSSDRLSVLTKQVTGAAAEAFLQSVPTFDVTWPMLPDGRPRAALPDGLRERLEASPCHFLKAESADRSFYQSWRDETIVLIRPEQIDPPRNVWHAGYLDGDGQLKLFRLALGCDNEYVCGATTFEAIMVLREHLMAWDVGAWVYLRPTRWTAAVVLELADVVRASEQAVLVADDELGLPTIHECPHPEHQGYGLFRAITNEYTTNYDAGGAMARLSNGLGYTHVRIERGVFPFDKAAVLTTLDHWTHELAMTERAVEDGDRPAQHAMSTDDLPTAYARREYNCLTRAAETARGKEPWQMMRDEFFATQRPIVDGAQHHTLLELIVIHERDVAAHGDNEWVSADILGRAVDYLDRLRETLVHIALAELKPVPDEVLHDFPDLAAKYAEASRSAVEDSSPHEEARTTVRGSSEPELAKRRKRIHPPDGIPELIEIDIGGRAPRWVTATIIKVSGQQLTCRCTDNGGTLKTKLYGRDIEWRVPASS